LKEPFIPSQFWLLNAVERYILYVPGLCLGKIQQISPRSEPGEKWYQIEKNWNKMLKTSQSFESTAGIMLSEMSTLLGLLAQLADASDSDESKSSGLRRKLKSQSLLERNIEIDTSATLSH
jgi:hypothetical protein